MGGRSDLCFFVIFVGYYLIGSSQRLWGWYCYPALLCSIFVLPFRVATEEERTAHWIPERKALSAARLLIATLTILIMLTAALKWGAWVNRGLAGDFQYQNHELARSLNGELPGAFLLAVGDRAGSLAYL